MSNVTIVVHHSQRFKLQHLVVILTAEYPYWMLATMSTDRYTFQSDCTLSSVAIPPLDNPNMKSTISEC